MKRWRTLLVRTLLLVVLLLPAAVWGVLGCRGSQPLHLRLNSDVVVPERFALLLFVDGMDQVEARELLAAGKLPHLKRWFVDGGVEIENTIVAAPPTTFPNAVSLLTGLLPGHHGILGNQWYDRDTELFYSYFSAQNFRDVNEHFSALTIYDLLGDELTVNVQCHTRRGATYSIDNVVLSAIKWFLGWYEGYDRRTGTSIEEVAQIANRERRWPLLTTLYFPGLDEVGHVAGSDSERYAGALRTVDAQLGRVISAMERAGIADRCYFALVTDHGHVPTTPDRTFELIPWLRETRGLRVRDLLSYEEDDLEPLELHRRVDVVALDGAFRRAVLHLPGPGGWKSRPEPAAVRRVLGEGDEAIAVQPGVGLVCVRGDRDQVEVHSRDGAIGVQRTFLDGAPLYRVVRLDEAPSADPARVLDYEGDEKLAAFVASGWHSSRAWLAATARANYPDFVPQIVEMFDSSRAGDIVVFAEPRWTLRAGERGGHGSATRSDICVSSYYAGPGLPRGAKLPYARLVDVMPTLLDLLGRREALERAGAIDGVSLAPELRAAGSPRP